MTVLRHAAAALVATSKNGKWHTLQAHEPLADIVVGGGVNGTTLSIAKELIESIISSTLTDLVVIAQLLRLVDCVVDWPVGRVLRRAAIETSRSSARVLLGVSGVGTKRTIRILISTRCSGKRLQVSDKFTVLASESSGSMRSAAVGLGRPKQNRVVSVRLNVLLQILGTLEGFAAEVALMRLQRNVNTNVRSNVITLDGRSAAVAPLARQVQVVGALATNMAFANMVIELFGRR